MLLGRAYEVRIDGHPAPQATLMKRSSKRGSRRAAVGSRAVGRRLRDFGAFLCGVSALAFAIGVYLPLATMADLRGGWCGFCARGKKEAAARQW